MMYMKTYIKYRLCCKKTYFKYFLVDSTVQTFVHACQERDTSTGHPFIIVHPPYFFCSQTYAGPLPTRVSMVLSNWVITPI